MNDSSVDISGNPQPAPRVERAVHRKSAIPRRLSRYISLMILLAALSTLAGYQVSRLEFPMARWFRSTSALASARVQPPAYMPASTPSATNADMEAISRLAPQQQAELFHLVLAALDSNDPRVRVAAVEIDLVANNLMKSPQSLAKLLHQIHNDPDSRYLALWRLGALGNRGVEPATVLTTLLRYSRDANQQTRFWAVEGLAMLGTEESIDPLLSILAHDPARKVRERAATNLARSGMLTGEQRLTAVPQLLNLLDDDSLEPATQDLIYAALRSITGASFGKDPAAWRDWWAHHDRPENRVHVPKGLLLA